MQVIIKKLLITAGLMTVDHELITQRFSGDGSDRGFFRCQVDGRSFIVIFPSTGQPKAMAEARAGFAIASHLYNHHLSVPRPYGFDSQYGAIIFDDLGHTLLYDVLPKYSVAQTKNIYQQVIKVLAALQIKGREGFDPEWCWDTSYYDQQLMLERESHYFSREFCHRYMGVTIPSVIEEEFVKLAARISHEPGDYLLHRDFQSRNIMLVQGRPWIIDFQGARIGPLGYDVASLLNDPYSNIKEDCKQELLGYYVQAVNDYLPLDYDIFMAGYHHIALQRNLQVLGAYAYLNVVKGKAFFRQFIRPALTNLLSLLNGPLSAEYPTLQKFILQHFTRLKD